MAAIREIKGKSGAVSYKITVTLGRDVNGKQIQKFYTYKPEQGMTQKQIEKAVNREATLFEERCKSGEVLDTQTKFAEFAELWMERKKDTLSPMYQSTVRSMLERINAGIGHIQIGKLKPHHLQALYANLAEPGIRKAGSTAISPKLSEILLEQGITHTEIEKLSGVPNATIYAACKGKAIRLTSAEKLSKALKLPVNKLFTINKNQEPLSAKTVLHHHRAISSILESAVKWQVIYDNPARRVEPPKVQKKEAAYLDDKQTLEVVNALSTAPIKWRTAVMLLVYSGMRRGELCALSWNDVDFVGGVVHIRKSSGYLPELGVYEKETKTESSERAVKLPPEMFSLLREYREWQSGERAKYGDIWHISNKVFTQDNGKPLHPGSVTKWIQKFRESNDLPYFTPHTLRHTSATLLIMAGVPVRAVAARLGHSSPVTTNTIYSHSIKTVDALASDVLGNVLKPIEKIKKSG